MRDLPILTVREIKEILTLINKEDQQLLGLLSALEGTAAQQARQLLRSCDRGELRELCKVG
jgi:succinate dehydrogenase flavin-adding protein (antitoxin of CptAB toxin-antitoxin module)